MDEDIKRGGWLEVLFLRPLRGGVGWAVYLSLLALLGVVYFHLGSVLIAETNRDLETVDQRANLDLAYASSGDWYPHRSSYIQPLWPWLSRMVMEEDMGEYFTQGRWLNLSLGYGMTVVLAVLAAWWMAPVPGVVVGWLGGFGVMLQRAHFFHPEPLLYFFFAATVVFMAMTLWRARWPWYAAWGVFFGLAYLAKASTGPLLAIYAGATIVLLLARSGWCPRWLVTRGEDGEWSFGRHAAGSLLAVLCAGAVMAPGAIYKHRVHGDAFFSPAKYWMWCEDWDTEAVPLTPLIQTAEQRAFFAPGELPSAANYLRKHGRAHAQERLLRGSGEMSWRFLVPVNKVNRALRWGMLKGDPEKAEPEFFWRYLLPARGLYLVWLALLAVLLLLARRWTDGPPLFRSPSALAALSFALAMMLVYLLAFGWYGPIIGWRGERFTLMLYLPLLIGLAWSCFLLARETGSRLGQCVYAAGLSAVLLHALVQTVLLVARPEFMPGI
jgi:MFS family permease